MMLLTRIGIIDKQTYRHETYSWMFVYPSPTIERIIYDCLIALTCNTYY